MRGSVRQTKKRKRKRKERKKPSEKSKTTQPHPKLSRFVVNKEKRNIHSLLMPIGTEEDDKRSRRKKKKQERKRGNKKIECFCM